MLKSGRLMCGGSIIGDNTVLTAAHCCDGKSASSISVRAGTLEHARGGVVSTAWVQGQHLENS